MIPIDGDMHLLMAVFAGIGQLYGDAGLLQLLHESGVYAPGTAQYILSGKDFDRAVRSLKIVDEVLEQRFMHQFHIWCEQNQRQFLDELKQSLDKLDQSFAEEQPNMALLQIWLSRILWHNFSSF